jgi:hypothetical protein
MSGLNTVVARPGSRAVPGPPGPPKLTNSDPIRSPGTAAGSRMSARLIRVPPGFT